jgi:hypothetical protein
MSLFSRLFKKQKTNAQDTPNKERPPTSWKLICKQCKHKFGMPKDQRNKACPNCGRVASFEDAEINPALAELLWIAFKQDLSEMEDVLGTRVLSAIQAEGREIVGGWLELIADMLEASPACTSERIDFVRHVCEKLRKSIGTLEERIGMLRKIMEEQGIDDETKELIENLNRTVEKTGGVEARSQLMDSMTLLDQNPNLTIDQKQRTRRIIENYMAKIL